MSRFAQFSQGQRPNLSEWRWHFCTVHTLPALHVLTGGNPYVSYTHDRGGVGRSHYDLANRLRTGYSRRSQDMLAKTVAAIKADKAKTLDQNNKGEGSDSSTASACARS
jgi:hypothetical protein